jgi:hypothetical protein
MFVKAAFSGALQQDGVGPLFQGLIFVHHLAALLEGCSISATKYSIEVISIARMRISLMILFFFYLVNIPYTSKSKICDAIIAFQASAVAEPEVACIICLVNHIQ